MAELILLGAAPPFFFLSVNLCFFTLYFCSVCFSSGFLLAFSAFFFLCFWVDFFVCRLSAEMKAMAMKTLYVCWISFLSFSLCIISLLWVFLLCFLCFFSLFLGSFFGSSFFPLLNSGFSSPFYREACPSTSPAFAGLLWNPRTR